MEPSKSLGEAYSAYMKINLKDELRSVEGTVEEMLTRLDEFENLLNLLRTDRVEATDQIVPAMLACTPALDRLCARVDQLESVVDRVEKDLTRVEEAVVQGEADLASVSAVSSITSFLKPLFSKNSVDTTPKRTPRTEPDIHVDSLYNTDDFFPSQ